MTKKERVKKKRAELVKAGLAGRRGAVGAITLPLVERVGLRVSKGIPIDYALALEEGDVSPEAFQKALQREPKLSAHFAKFKAVFVAEACERLSAGEMADLKWLLVRRHPEIFAMPSERAEERGSGGNVEDALQGVINRSRELARLKMQLSEGNNNDGK